MFAGRATALATALKYAALQLAAIKAFAMMMPPE
jgi:hypothetical protein